MPSEAPSLLPPQATPLERALEAATARASAVATPIERMLDPATIEPALLPWLGWALSIDRWNTDWSVTRKRAEVAGAIAEQRRKGTRASVRAVLDRFDPLIRLLEWWETNPKLSPHRFRLQLPLAPSAGVTYDEPFLRALLRDIATVKPVRAHLDAVQTLLTAAGTFLAGGALTTGWSRLDGFVDQAVVHDPIWARLLQTEQGEPIRGGAGEWLEAA